MVTIQPSGARPQDSRHRIARRDHAPRRRQRRLPAQSRHLNEGRPAVVTHARRHRLHARQQHALSRPMTNASVFNVFIWDVATGNELRRFASAADASLRLASPPTARCSPRPANIQRSCCGGWRNHDDAIPAPSAARSAATVPVPAVRRRLPPPMHRRRCWPPAVRPVVVDCPLRPRNRSRGRPRRRHGPRAVANLRLFKKPRRGSSLVGFPSLGSGRLSPATRTLPVADPLAGPQRAG